MNPESQPFFLDSNLNPESHVSLESESWKIILKFESQKCGPSHITALRDCPVNSNLLDCYWTIRLETLWWNELPDI